MQTQHGAAAEAAILASERTFRARVKVDWSGNGLFNHSLSDIGSFVESVTTDRSLRGSAPEEIMLIEGASAAELSIDMSGEVNGMPLTYVFSPYNTASPVYGLPIVGSEITYELGIDTPLGTFWYPQFVGNVRTVTPNRADNAVKITALDRVEKLRRPVQFAPYAAAEVWINKGRTKAQLLNSSWIIDHCLKHCDTSPTPYRWPYRDEQGLEEGSLDGIQLWVSHNGGWTPNLGWLTGYDEQSFAAPELTGQPVYERKGLPHPDAPDPTMQPYALTALGSEGNVGVPSDVYNANRGSTSSKRFNRYWSLDRDLINPRATHYFGFTLNTTGTNGAYYKTAPQHILLHIHIGGYQHVQILCENGTLRISRVYASNHPTNPNLRVNGPTLAVPATAGHYQVFGILDNTTSGGTRARLSIGSNTTGWQTISGSPAQDYSSDWLKGLVQVCPSVSMTDIFYAVRSASPGTTVDTSQGYVPARYPATLDEGLQNLSFLPIRNGDDAWDVITSVAGAEYGSVFWDEEGRFQFWNLRSVLAKQNTVVRRYNLDDVDGLEITNTLDSVRNIWSIAQTRAVETSYGNCYESNSVDEFYVPGRTIKTFKIWVDDVYAPNGAPVDFVSAQTWQDQEHFLLHKFAAQYLNGSTWAEVLSASDISVRANYDGLGNLTIRIANNRSQPIRLAYGTEGLPAFHLGGTKVNTSDPSVRTVSDHDSITTYGGRNLKVEGDWIQDGFSLDVLRQILMPRTLKPTPTTDAITVSGDPRIQLGDAIEIDDPQGFGTGIRLQVYGITRTFNVDEGLTDTYTVEMILPYEEPIVSPEPEEPATTLRRNLCPNPSLKNNTSGWFGPSGSGRVSGVTGMPRTTGYRVTQPEMAIAPKGLVSPGSTYRFSAYIEGEGSSSGTAYIDWYDSGGYLSSTTGVAWSVTAGQVVRVDSGAQTAPAGAVQGLLVITGIDDGCTIGSVLYEQASTLGTYIDGDSTSAVWDGANGNSTSRTVL